MTRNWRQAFRDLFAVPADRSGSTRHQARRIDLGVCPGCRGLRLTTSQRCEHCGNTSPVTADA